MFFVELASKNSLIKKSKKCDNNWYYDSNFKISSHRIRNCGNGVDLYKNVVFMWFLKCCDLHVSKYYKRYFKNNKCIFRIKPLFKYYWKSFIIISLSLEDLLKLGYNVQTIFKFVNLFKNVIFTLIFKISSVALGDI